MGRNLGERTLVALIAAAALTWLTVALLDLHSLHRAYSAVFSRPHSSQQLRRGLSDASSAGRLRPGDEQPRIFRAELTSLERRPRAALSIMRRVVRSEPRNPLATSPGNSRWLSAFWRPL